MPKLPRASGLKHVRAFERDGWVIDRIKGSHYIMLKEGHEATLSIPVHPGEVLNLGTLKGLIRDAGLTNQEYIDLFYKRRKRGRK